MEIGMSTKKRKEYIEKIKTAVKEPKYSPFIILGVPFLLALPGVVFEPLFILIIFIGPIGVLAYYAYYTGNKIPSAILGLLVIPLMFFYVEPLARILDFQFGQLGRYFELSYICGIVDDFWKYSIAHAFIGYLIAYRKKTYLAIALLLFILQFVELISHID